MVFKVSWLFIHSFNEFEVIWKIADHMESKHQLVSGTSLKIRPPFYTPTPTWQTEAPASHQKKCTQKEITALDCAETEYVVMVIKIATAVPTCVNMYK